MGLYNRKDSENSRFGFIVSTKISKKAIVRNRIKRVMAEIVRSSLNKLKNGYDVVFLIKPSVTKIDRESLEKETYEVITKNL